MRKENIIKMNLLINIKILELLYSSYKYFGSENQIKYKTSLFKALSVLCFEWCPGQRDIRTEIV
jgi:hypothetical protein